MGYLMNKIYITTSSNELKAFFPEEILYFHSDGSYTQAYLTEERMETLCKPLKDVESSVDPTIFVRINHQTIINLSHIQNLKKGDQLKCTLSNGEEFLVSRRKRNEFIKRIDQTNTFL